MEPVKGRLLVVDDDPTSCKLLSSFLEKEAYAVTTAMNGEKALKYIEEQSFDVVLLDIMMPDMNGLDVLKHLRKTYAMAALPVIMVTALKQTEDMVWALETGANDYITKPIDLKMVLARVRTQLALKRAEDARRKSEQDLASQIRQQEALLSIGHAVQEMTRPFDLMRVLQVCLSEVRKVGLDVQSMAVHRILDPKAEIVETFRVGSKEIPVNPEKRSARGVVENWRRGRIVYESDIEKRWTEGRVQSLRHRLGNLPIRSFMNIPFSQGVISFYSTKARAFLKSDIQIVVRVCEILSVGLSRLGDLIALADRMEELREKERLLAGFHRIGQLALSSLNLDEMLDTLAEQVIQAGIFRSPMVALVDESAHRVEVVRSLKSRPQTRLQKPVVQPTIRQAEGLSYDLDDRNLTAEVARTGKFQVVEGWDDRFDSRVSHPEDYDGKVAYFLPVKHGDRVLAVLATGSQAAEKAATLERIEAMQPLLDRVGNALEHARLYREGQEHTQELAEINERIGTEIAEREQAESALRSRNALLSAQQQATLDGILVVDEDGKWVSYNRQFIEMWGISPEVEAAGISEIAVQSVLEKVADPQQFKVRIQYLYEHPEEIGREEIELIDGRVFDRYSSPTIGEDGRYYGRVWYYRDMTDRKRTDAALRQANEELESRVAERTRDLRGVNEKLRAEMAERRQAEETAQEIEVQFQQTLDNMDEVFFMATLDLSRILYLSPSYERIWKRSRKTVHASPVRWLMTIHPEDRKRAIGVMKGLHEKPCEVEYRIVLPDQSVRWIRSRILTLKNESGEFYRTVGFTEDITERKQMDAALKESEERFRQLAENIREVFYISDLGKPGMLYVSPAFEEVWGCSREDLYENPMSFMDAIRDEDREKVAASLEQQAQGVSTEMEYRIVRPDGTVCWIWDQAFPILDPGGKVYRVVGIAEDISEQKQLTQQLLQSQKMEAVGQLAGGVAHDFNNLLTAINGYSKLLMRELDEADPMRGHLEEIHKAGNRAASLTHQLLAFSRKQIMQPEVLDLNDVIVHLQKMLQRLIGEDIEMVVTLGASQSYVEADPGQLEQVVMNLVVNARDAMPQGGRMEIGTADVTLNDAFTRQHDGITPGPYVMLSVQDTGCGMSLETQNHIFEPFFTTKEQGKGTGLGLATVYGIVGQNRGCVAMDSKEGLGTTFKIYLPQYENVVGQGNEDGVVEDLLEGRETVLLVEDDGMVRVFTQQVLCELGYTVLDAEDGEAAYGLYEQYDGEIDLLVTDVVMPKMSGRELAERLQASRPELKVLYVSGYTDDKIGEHGVMDADVAFLQKPFTPEDLSAKVREVLDGWS